MGRKGIALAIDTVILLVLGVIVLGALLAFFLGIFGPVPPRVGIIQLQTDLCEQIQVADPGCDVSKVPADIVSDLRDDVCNQPPGNPVCRGETAQECVQTCCRIFCG